MVLFLSWTSDFGDLVKERAWAEEQGEDLQMATPIASQFADPIPAQAISIVRKRANRRHITPQAGHALETLGHAIEYLTDEFVHDGAGMAPGNGQLEAVQLLMAVNRQIYYECPEFATLTLMERLRSAMHLNNAA